MGIWHPTVAFAQERQNGCRSDPRPRHDPCRTAQGAVSGHPDRYGQPQSHAGGSVAPWVPSLRLAGARAVGSHHPHRRDDAATKGPTTPPAAASLAVHLHHMAKKPSHLRFPRHRQQGQGCTAGCETCLMANAIYSRGIGAGLPALVPMTGRQGRKGVPRE